TCGRPPEGARSDCSASTAASCTSAVSLPSRSNFSSPTVLLCFCAEREAELAQERERLFIRVRRRRDGDVEAAHGLHVVVVDLRKDDLLPNPNRIVAPAVEARRREAAEVANARERDRDEAVQELPHAGAAKGHFRADGH